MKWAVVLTLSISAWFLALHFAPVDAGTAENLWVKAYQQFARTPIFTAFLTLGSFLLTLKTTIIQRLKESYETADYERKYRLLRKTEPRAKYYGSLERLSLALASNVIFAMVTSILQMTVGFVASPIAVSICLGFATTALALVIFLTVNIFLAHREWFTKIEEMKQAELKKQEDEGNKANQGD